MRCRQNLNKVLTVATLVARNANETAESAFGESLEKGGRFCIGAFGRNLPSVVLKMFSHFIKFVLSMIFAKIMLQ
jgi:hypothetical protein